MSIWPTVSRNRGTHHNRILGITDHPEKDVPPDVPHGPEQRPRLEACGGCRSRAIQQVVEVLFGALQSRWRSSVCGPPLGRCSVGSHGD